MLHAWSEFPELIPDTKIIENFKDKSKKMRKQKKTSLEVQSNSMDVDDTEIELIN